MQYLHFHIYSLDISAPRKGISVLLGNQANQNGNYHSHSYHNSFDHIIQCHQDGYMYMANLMQFTSALLQPPSPTSTPRPRKCSNRRRRRGRHPPITETVTAQSPRPTSMPSPSQAQGNRKRPRNGDFGPPRPLEPGETLPTTTATPQSTSTPRPKKNRKCSSKRRASTGTAVPPPPRPTETGQPTVTILLKPYSLPPLHAKAEVSR